MYTNLYFDVGNARIIYDVLVFDRDASNGTFDYTFGKFTEAHIALLGVSLKKKHPGLFVLGFPEYLSEVPELIVMLGAEIDHAEILRFNQVGVQIQAGYYVDRDRGITAFVENTIAAGSSANLSVTHIKVSGPDLGNVLKFNSQLSQGQCAEYLRDPM